MKKISKDTRRNLQVSSVVIGFVTMLLMAVWSGQASAADVGKRIIDGVWHITYDGQVVEGDTDKLKTMLEDNPDIEWVSFNSPGGNGFIGNEINDLLHEYVMSSRVREGNKCMSACANAFIGGHVFSVEGTLGFHSFRYGSYDGEGKTRVDKKQIRESIYYAQADATYDLYKIMVNGFSWDLHYDYTKLFGEFLEFNSNEELKKYYSGEIKFSNEFITSREEKEFHKFEKKKDKSSQTFSYGTRVKFKTAGTKTFHKNSYASGLSSQVYVSGASSWITGRQVGVYTYIHTGKNLRGETLAYGWVSTYLLEER